MITFAICFGTNPGLTGLQVLKPFFTSFRSNMAAILFVLGFTKATQYPLNALWEASTNRHITLDSIMIWYIIMAVFLFPSVGWRPFWILLILRYFPWTDFLGLFFTHYRGINEVISIEKPFPSIFLNLTVYNNLYLPDYDVWGVSIMLLLRRSQLVVA